MNMKRILRVAIVVSLVLPFSAQAAGRGPAGVAIAADDVPAADRAQLAAWIAAYRKTNPGAFAAVAGVNGCKPAGYTQARYPEPECSRELRALGAGVLPALIEALAFAVPPGHAQNAKEKKAFALGLTFAAGLAQNPKAAPVLRAIATKGNDADVRREAGLGLGRIAAIGAAGNGELRWLLDHAKAGDPVELDALAGLGESMTVAGAERLAQALQAKPAAAKATVVATALASLASSWAWQARARKDAAAAGVGLQVRTIAARSAVQALAGQTGEAREKLFDVVAMAKLAETAHLLNDARGSADAQLRADLDAFQRRYALTTR
jgi:hypothetical protein